ncbi:MAG: collagen-like protein [Candidatus Colwellbacteria bacterium]|nr:collagen-like protein [Candidatus Colwellbacteria bacterium]
MSFRKNHCRDDSINSSDSCNSSGSDSDSSCNIRKCKPQHCNIQIINQGWCPQGNSITGATGPQGNSITGATGPQGNSITGATGPQGNSITGATGPQGNSITGATGPQGDSITGATGPQGNSITGPQGNSITGATGPSNVLGYGYVYNLTSTTVAIESPINFDTNGPLLGISHTPSSPSIIFSESGVYSIIFSVSGTQPNQFAIFINGVPDGSTIYGSGAGTQQNTGPSIILITSGDVLTLVNHSSASAVTLDSVIGGTQANVNASIQIVRIA